MGTQTLLRGMAVIDAVAEGALTLAAIGVAIGCTRSTTHRLATALIQAGYLRLATSGSGGMSYRLGPKLVELGFLARETMPVVQAARPHLDRLAALTQDTVHLGISEGSEVLYLDKIPGQRGLEMRSRIGRRMPMASTGVGKALMLDMTEARWRGLYDVALVHPATPNVAMPGWDEYRVAMQRFAAQGAALDMEENEIGIRCVAAPVRDAGAEIVAAISVASATPYMPEDRMDALVPKIIDAAQSISRDLGWTPRRMRAQEIPA
ncbi:IclR family transcriptional regulator [Acidisphaera sp. L21]|uniref:IclR family transcriptional regulator n=1 Tax=Acidisphaera sp. L21 TaxID=1641851 RepID=UPI0038D0C5D8